MHGIKRLTTSSPKIVNKKRDRLFFDKYEYSISFLIPFSATLRGCTKPNFLREDLEDRIRNRYALYNQSTKIFEGFNWILTLRNVDPAVLVEKLTEVYIFLNELSNCKIVFNNDWITIYSHNLDLYSELTKLSSDHIRIAKAILHIPRGSVTCRHSQHKYRIYLRHTKITIEEHNNMKQFIETYKDHIFQSKVFSEWVADNWNRYRPSEYYFFFETDELGLAQMLDLTVPGLKSRVCRIISDKYNTTEDYEKTI